MNCWYQPKWKVYNVIIFLWKTSYSNWKKRDNIYCWSKIIWFSIFICLLFISIYFFCVYTQMPVVYPFLYIEFFFANNLFRNFDFLFSNFRLFFQKHASRFKLNVPIYSRRTQYMLNLYIMNTLENSHTWFLRDKDLFWTLDEIHFQLLSVYQTSIMFQIHNH